MARALNQQSGTLDFTLCSSDDSALRINHFLLICASVSPSFKLENDTGPLLKSDMSSAKYYNVGQLQEVVLDLVELQILKHGKILAA